MNPITEAELRAQARLWLAPRAVAGTSLVEEFGVDRGSARIDLALIGDSQFEAFEIKSDFDTFARLAMQIHTFNRVFDRLWIITGPTHIESALRIVPRWWGILSGQRRIDGDVQLQEVRAATENPAKDALSLAMLLWRDEAVKLITDNGLGPVSKRATRYELGERLASALDLDSLQQLVAKMLGARITAVAL